jgi:hypothetical protein
MEVAGMSRDLEKELYERDWLIGLVEDSARHAEVTDCGAPPAEFVYQVGTRRFEVTIKEVS